MRHRPTTASGALLLYGFILVGCVSEKPKVPTSEVTNGQTSGTPPGQISISNLPIESVLPAIRVWRDKSSSMSENDAKVAVSEFLASIHSHTSMFSGIEVVPFAKGNEPIWSARVERFLWGDPPEIENFDASHSPNAPVATKIFVGAKSSYVNRRRAEYDQKTAGLIDDYERTVMMQLQNAGSYLLEAPVAEAPCTKFASLKRRITEEGLAYNLVITDGWIDCSKTSQLQNISPLMRGKIVILLLTRSADTQNDEEAFEQRAKDMKTIFPTAKIVPVFLAATAVDELLK